ncbi:MAG TPA: hypothetical protein VHB53_04595 [Solirubrobacterales bacterium]|nr:hypothetical protein [Solirubrobacterales bacterium]
MKTRGAVSVLVPVRVLAATASGAAKSPFKAGLYVGGDVTFEAKIGGRAK